MGCVQPPLNAKPTRGYGWTCGPCSRAHEQAVEGHDVRPVPSPPAKPKSHAPPARGRGRPRKDRTLAEKEESVPVRHFKMWPFRYFGSVSSLDASRHHVDMVIWLSQIAHCCRRYPRWDTHSVGRKWMLRCASYPDPDDLIFPRTTTRVGTKYQASIPLKDGPRDPGKNKFRR